MTPPNMGEPKDPMTVKVIAALLCDVQTLHNEVFSSRACRLTTQKVRKRLAREGMSFLTKTLPRLAKAIDLALAGNASIDATKLRLTPQPNSKLPRFLGELFNQVFAHDGRTLPTPCVNSIKTLRQVLYLFYKYELPYETELKDATISKFIQTEEDIKSYSDRFADLAQRLESLRVEFAQSIDTRTSPDKPRASLAELKGKNPFEQRVPATGPLGDASSISCRKDSCMVERQRRVSRPDLSNGVLDELHRRNSPPCNGYPQDGHESVCLGLPVPYAHIRAARDLLTKVFGRFDPTDIHPRHGPGAVSTKEQLWGKYQWTVIPDRLAQHFPIDKFFYASLGHVCDALQEIQSLGGEELSARVILVPKDSRGPRLISCEPLANMWIQQGLFRAMVRSLESHPLTRWNIHFTDQQPNQLGALLGSLNGKYATLDLAEASDRVSVGLVKLLFPEPLLGALLASRSLTTVLPSGQVQALNKFAPMGSAVCFPVLAACVWAILAAGAPDTDTRESILVYGDDVVVPTAHAANAIAQLESFGLKVNRDKSCTSGLFRESCGMDAFSGIPVTPVRFRTVWQSSRSPDVYSSWISYANSLYDRRYFRTYDLIAGELLRIYGRIPESSMGLPCPSLREVPESLRHFRTRISPCTEEENLQKRQWLVWCVVPRVINHSISGWKQLLRYFAEATSDSLGDSTVTRRCDEGMFDLETGLPFSVSAYTRRGAVRLVPRWVSADWKLLKQFNRSSNIATTWR